MDDSTISSAPIGTTSAHSLPLSRMPFPLCFPQIRGFPDNSAGSLANSVYNPANSVDIPVISVEIPADNSEYFPANFADIPVDNSVDVPVNSVDIPADNPVDNPLQTIRHLRLVEFIPRAERAWGNRNNRPVLIHRVEVFLRDEPIDCVTLVINNHNRAARRRASDWPLAGRRGGVGGVCRPGRAAGGRACRPGS